MLRSEGWPPRAAPILVPCSRGFNLRALGLSSYPTSPGAFPPSGGWMTRNMPDAARSGPEKFRVRCVPARGESQKGSDSVPPS